ncbi:PREDICTED: methyl-CpG-binding domain-containing protein 1 [Camelina sativa]|uniref:Methyl-CpG-binding domain-containing protein 1 n=1 Tax=Camelina sativa TaxID=90675 RepID=A0ABM0UCV4_CAMSA|nr:PREDICTED: methyl-CpG-binding domain-containing protein 1 [Camelina sativa]XP_010439297.1 PREDICTED: methyl-CpG-binding domain-containing protein 1 [Camelina sativa]
MDARSADSTTLESKANTSSEMDIDIFAVQCEECYKWRQINTLEDYEYIRRKLRDDEFVCERIEGMTCKDAEELKYDSSKAWAIDKPGLLETPRGFERNVVMRTDYSGTDVYYITSIGKKLETHAEVAAFIEANPDYSNAPLGDFDFTAPLVMEDTVPSVDVETLEPSKEND